MNTNELARDLAALGAFAVNFAPQDLLILLVLGIVGFFMRRYGYPVAPLVVGMILGPIFERQLRTALQIWQGDWTPLVRSPFAVAIYVALAVLLALSVVLRRREQALEEDLAAGDTGDRTTSKAGS